MYKCGWNGCEKAYGTLNHLNAHVTMQSHGQKRTPEGKSLALSSRSHQHARAGVWPSLAREGYASAATRQAANSMNPPPPGRRRIKYMK